MYRYLRYCRIVFSLLFLIAVTLVFVDVSDHARVYLQSVIKWQFVPAFLGSLASGLGILLLLIVFTFLFGRVYCSFLCPTGILQDVIITMANFLKSKKKRKYHYAKPHNMLRYVILALVFVVLILGNAVLLELTDPYSNYGRMAENVFRPAVISLNNTGASLFSETFYRISYKTFTGVSVIAGIMFFIVLTVMSILRGRLYCNTICPVGSLLGLASKYSLLRIGINKEKCTSCRLCELSCKAQCINISEGKIDVSRCVQCYNCMTACRYNSMRFQFAYPQKKNKVLQLADPNKRRIFLVSAGILGAAAFFRIVIPKLRLPIKNTKAIAPPGAQSIEHLKSYCTACHACIAKCPSNVIRPALAEYGMDGFLMPVMDYNNAYCNYTCTECSNICPNGALLPLTYRKKITTQIGKAHFNEDYCIVKLDGTDCGACDEHCPTKAVHMVDYVDGLLIPEVDTELCIGCGGCEYICPGRPSKAIYVIANEKHLYAKIPANEKQEKIEADFGF